MRNSAYKKPHIKSRFYDDFIQKIPCQKGKTFAITGTTSGTGFVAAKTIAQKQGRVILLNRKSDRSTSAFEALQKSCPNSELINIECDLSSFVSVRKAVKEIFLYTEDGLDVLCNNAGVMALKDLATVDGFDIQMQTNHLSHFLLTKALFPLLIKASQKHNDARIVNHSSIARLGVKSLEQKYLEKEEGTLVEIVVE